MMGWGHSSKRVLLVDDDALVRRSVGRLLLRDGHAVIEAEGGRAAIAVLRNEPVDVVLTDLHMPDLDGIELIIAVRAMLPDIPVVAMSGDSPERFASLLDAAMLGAVVTLQKPFEARELLEAIALACDDRLDRPG